MKLKREVVNIETTDRYILFCFVLLEWMGIQSVVFKDTKEDHRNIKMVSINPKIS